MDAQQQQAVQQQRPAVSKTGDGGMNMKLVCNMCAVLYNLAITTRAIIQ